MSNAPDEAERLLDDLSKAVVYLERWKHRRDQDEQNWHDEANCERDVIRSQLLPLIRSGLALQRLEKWQDDGPGRECHREIIDGMVHIRLLVRDKLVAFGVSVTAKWRRSDERRQRYQGG